MASQMDCAADMVAGRDEDLAAAGGGASIDRAIDAASLEVRIIARGAVLTNVEDALRWSNGDFGATILGRGEEPAASQRNAQPEGSESRL